MSKTSNSNRRLAKNTLMLYVRMLFTLSISLYTSRVILSTLGVEDFGIYNVVGGVVAMLGFLTASLGSAAARFISFSIGTEDKQSMKDTFSSLLLIHIILASSIFFFGETIGLWFLENKMSIPVERELAAFWVYQCSIISSMLSVMYVPYNASIIAHERMSVYAYFSIIDVSLKLVIVYLLSVIPFDKLVAYAVLLAAVHLFMQLFYITYCITHFKETKMKPAFNKKIFNEVLSFTGWNTIGNLSTLANTQGLNVLLNLFFGPAVNAARGIAVQVQGVVRSFVINFQVAVNPQITKSYAISDTERLHQLIRLSSKFSFYLMLFLSLPLMLEAELVLKWWLGIVPDHTVAFLRLVLCSTLIYTLSNPLCVSVYASGRLKKYQIADSIFMLSVLPLSYILLKYLGVDAEFVFVVHFVLDIMAHYVRLKIVMPLINMSMVDYFTTILTPIVKVIFVAPLIPLFIYSNINQNVYTFLFVCIICVISTITTFYFCGIDLSERIYVQQKISYYLNKVTKK